MSAKDGAITQRMPKSSSAQGACSRDEPQPKFAPATRIFAFLYAGLFSTKSGFCEPSGFVRCSKNSAEPSPVRLIVFRNCLGMIMSVSTLTIGSGAATPERVLKGCMVGHLYGRTASRTSRERLLCAVGHCQKVLSAARLRAARRKTCGHGRP